MSDFVLCSRSKLQRDQDRDISELIALGVPNPRSASEAQYDQRLFNQSKVRTYQTCVSVDLQSSGPSNICYSPQRGKKMQFLNLKCKYILF